jgi:uncharacterized protein (DUF2267 family)
MSITLFDKSVHHTNEWVADVAAELKIVDKEEAFRCLRAVIQSLRDQMDPVEASQLAAHLTPLLRGVYYEGWRPGHDSRARTAAEFCDLVLERHGVRPFVNPQTMVQGVSVVLRERLGEGVFRQVMDRLPESVWRLFRQPVG